jgi:hypothetical protein
LFLLSGDSFSPKFHRVELKEEGKLVQSVASAIQRERERERERKREGGREGGRERDCLMDR